MSVQLIAKKMRLPALLRASVAVTVSLFCATPLHIKANEKARTLPAESIEPSAARLAFASHLTKKAIILSKSKAPFKDRQIEDALYLAHSMIKNAEFLDIDIVLKMDLVAHLNLQMQLFDKPTVSKSAKTNRAIAESQFHIDVLLDRAD
jgi:hypothetical protein